MLNKIKQYMAANLGISDDETVKMLIDSFNESCDRHLEELGKSIQTGDFDKIRIDSHTIKGCAANIGAEEIFRTALAMENAVKEKRTDECPLLLKELTKLCGQLK